MATKKKAEQKSSKKGGDNTVIATVSKPQFPDNISQEDLKEKLKEYNHRITAKDRRAITTPLIKNKIITKAGLSQMLSGTFISQANMPVAKSLLEKIYAVVVSREAQIKELLA